MSAIHISSALALALWGCAPRADAPAPQTPPAPVARPPKPAASDPPIKGVDPVPAQIVVPTTPAASRSCQVRWSADGNLVAGVSDRAVEIRSVDGSQPARVLASEQGTRALDYSFVVDQVLRERSGKVELVKPGVADPYFIADPTTSPAPVVLSDDGGALFHGRTDDMGLVDDQEFLDLRTSKKTPINVPHWSAGGSDQVVVRIRRESVEVAQSRILGALYDYRAPETDKKKTRGLGITNCFATEGEGKAKLFAMDVDQAFDTAVVARIPCDKPVKKPVVEVYDRIKDGDDHVSRSWSPSGVPTALDLSANGKRLILTLQRGGGLLHEVWDTTNGKHLGDVTLQADCFELSPDGSRVASMHDSVLDVRPVL